MCVVVVQILTLQLDDARRSAAIARYNAAAQAGAVDEAARDAALSSMTCNRDKSAVVNIGRIGVVRACALVSCDCNACFVL